MHVALVVVTCIIIYMLGGAVSVIGTNYVHSLITGKEWFNDWTGSESSPLPPPPLVFMLWFIVVPCMIIGFVLSGIFTAISDLASKAAAAAEAHRKRNGDHRENPK